MKIKHDEMSKLYDDNKEQILSSHNEIILELKNKLKEA